MIKRSTENIAAEPAADALAFEGLSGKKVQALVDKLAAATEPYQGEKLLKKAGLEPPRNARFAWHVAAQGLLSPTHDPLLALLVPSYEAIEASAEQVFAVLRALPERPEVPHTRLLAGWSVLEARIAARGVALDGARAESLLPELAPRVRLGVQLARGLAGAALSDADRAAITAAMAQVDVLGQLVASSNGAQSLHGSPSDPSTQIAVPLGVLAAIGVDEAMYVRALAAAVREHGIGSFDRARPALVSMALTELVDALRRDSEDAPSILTYSHVPPKIAALLAERADAPDALRAAAASLGDKRHERVLASLLVAQG